MPVYQRVRKAKAADILTVDPVLAFDEIGLETDTGKYKNGNGTARFSALAYAASGANFFPNAYNESVSAGYVGTFSEWMAELESATYSGEYLSVIDEATRLASNVTALEILTSEIEDVIGGGIQEAIDALVDAAPGTLDTLNELAAALADDPNFATTITTALASKVDNTTLTAGYAAATTVILAADGTDQTATFQAAINSAMGASGNGWLFIPVNGTIRIDGQITFPNDAGGVPKQRPLRITGIGSSHSGQGSAPSGGTILDMRYASGTKFLTLGLGRLVLEHLTFTDTTDGTQNFILTTNTTLLVDDVEFWGKTPTTPAQDAIVLGGTSTVHDGTISAPFQGYGTVISNCYFNRVRRLVYGRTYCNGVVIRDNTSWTQCGADASAAAIEFIGLAAGSSSGNIVQGNVIEMLNYVYGIKSQYAVHNVFGPNGFFDAAAGTLGYHYFGANATYNLVVDGFRDDTKALIVENGASVGTNTTITSHQGQSTVFTQPVTITNANVAGTMTFTGPSLNSPIIQPAASQSDSSLMLRMLRSAAEGTNPGTNVFQVQQNGLITLGGSQAGNIDFKDAAGTLVGQFTGAGKNWIAAGAGGAMSQNSGSGGSYFTMRNYGLKLLDQAGANAVTIKNGSGSPEGAFAAPVGSIWLRTDGGTSTTFYVKETGAATNAGWVAQGALASAAIPKVATQAGTPAAPTSTSIWQFNAPATDTHGPFQMVIGGANFVSTFDRVMYFGYNGSDGGGKVVAAEPAFTWNIESDYDDGTKHTVEAYWAYTKGSGASGASTFRPIFMQINRATGAMQFELNNTAGFIFSTTDGTQTQWGTLTPQGLSVTPLAGQSASLSLGWVTGGINFLQIGNSTNTFLLEPLAAASATWEMRIGATQVMRLSSGTAWFSGGGTFSHLLEVSAVDGVAIRVEDTPGVGYSLIRFKRTADTQYRFRIDDETNATLKWGPGGSTATDTTLYRSAAGVLKTDGALAIVGNVGFYNTAPVAKPTGVAVDAAGIHAALVTLGLIAA